MRLLIIIGILCVSSSVCLGQDSALGKADFYWPSVTTEAERKQRRENSVAFESIMTESLRVWENIKDMQWEKADKYCKQTLRLYSDHMFLGYLEQAIAFRMLYNKNLLSEPIGENQRDALGFYLDLLLQNNTPDTYTVYQGLQALQSTWSLARLKEAASQTHPVGAKWLASPYQQINMEEGVAESQDVRTLRIWNMRKSHKGINGRPKAGAFKLWLAG